MTKALGVTIGIVGIVATTAVLWILGMSCFSYGDENYRWSSTASDFRVLEMAIKLRYAEGTLTLDELEKLQNIDDFAALVKPKLEDQSIALVDNRSQPLLFERQEHEDRVVLTVRSTIKYRKPWFWHKDRPLVLEITVFRDRQKHFEVKQLWRVD